MRKAGIKEFICTLGILFVLNVGSVFNQINQNYGTWGSTINWNGVKGPFRFENYCSPKDKVGWTVGGYGEILYQSTEKGFYQDRKYRLPTQDSEISFYGVWFDTKGTGWVVGGEGTIMHTTDNGYSWQQQISNTTEDLDAITCIDNGHCWILGRDEVFLRTTDGGKSWQLLDVLENASADVIDFVNTNDGWVADSGEDVLYRTTDGGKTWTRLVGGKMNNGVYDDLFSGIEFVNERVGWAAGMDKVGYTDDGGKTWRVTEIGEGRRQYFVGIASYTERSALAVNKGEWNYCTEDAGKSWKKCFRRKDTDRK